MILGALTIGQAAFMAVGLLPLALVITGVRRMRISIIGQLVVVTAFVAVWVALTASLA